MAKVAAPPVSGLMQAPNPAPEVDGAFAEAVRSNVSPAHTTLNAENVFAHNLQSPPKRLPLFLHYSVR